ncbi:MULTISPECIES: sensor histidine kinase [Aminobacter]|jgi:PAS domain S-box-containing protein|uniref:Blue-light-activated histidine kinase n=2 Tax=Aminobacter TaxID=31988 RepID=A0AAC8YKE7_AMIAI|nr:MULTISPECIES: PAS domain S-box protein [Aminobacter]AMS40002.1 Signal transduction histidine kinase [Aminobacter aminovorans]MBA8910876.1 PAS domain S-box-containing protein [Aminobacter ciceronei]MBA9024656.1 PAS domain S-box-containing protein [Aminobacter ciceronei]MBB3709378.1 PAS domain S-box-containing protein [Aminobacter aminovorans]MRX36780.1 PAS domain S-box protein [Aminobacter sp. MDW-2]
MTNRETLLGGLPAAVYTTDASGRITFFNEAAAALWGHRPEIGKDSWCGSWRLRTAEGEPLAHGDCPMARALKEGRAIRNAEAIAERPDGTLVPFLAFPAPIRDETGEITGAINLLVDISAQKQAEIQTQRLASIVESSDDAIVSKDLCGVIQSWNAGATRLFGYSADEAIGKHVRMLIPDDRQDEEDVILGKVRSGQRVDHFDTIRKRKDGSLVFISLTVSPVLNGAGKVIGASKIARDITERKESESRIRMLMREVNHRVKNQFAVILSMIRETGKHATTIAEFDTQIRNRIMALSQSQDLLVDGDWRGADLADLVSNQIRPFAAERRITISGEPVLLSTMAVQNLGMAFHELATNSAKHGALSSDLGTVEIGWTASDRFRLTWKETNGPTVGKASRKGFGRIVLERVAPLALNGVGHLSFQPDGVTWTLDAPLDLVRTPAP